MNERMYKFPLILEPQPEGGYTITSPVVPELVTEADTLDQVIPPTWRMRWKPCLSYITCIIHKLQL